MTWSELELEQRDRDDALGQALRALPPPRAPRTLAPRVMAAVRARAAGRADRTWFTWPAWAQVASLLAFVGLVASASLVWPALETLAGRVEAFEAVRVAAIAFRAVWQPLAFWFVAGVTATLLLGATFGALLSRIALGGASR